MIRLEIKGCSQSCYVITPGGAIHTMAYSAALRDQDTAQIASDPNNSHTVQKILTQVGDGAS